MNTRPDLSSRVVLLHPRSVGAPGGGEEAALSGAATHWLHAGPLSGWAWHERRRSRGIAPRRELSVVLTEVADPRASAVPGEWVREQRLLVEPRHRVPAIAPGTVFWRLAINRKPVALCALPCPNVRVALGRARRLIRGAARLEVSLGFFADRLEPRWVLHDGGVPVVIGLPTQALVATREPECSLASLVAAATVQSYVHRAGEGG